MNDSIIEKLSNSRKLASSEVADNMSQSLSFSLRRQYLNIPLNEAKYIHVSEQEESSEEPHFLKLVQVGGNCPTFPQQALIAFQTALSACHAPGKQTLIFVVSSNGHKNEIYLGIRGHQSYDQTFAFIEYLDKFLEANWPGTHLERCNNVDSQILYPISQLKTGVALTGVPSLKKSNHSKQLQPPGDFSGYPQSLDRLLRGMQGKPFTYVVVAEPMFSAEVDGIINSCRDLIGQVHTLTKITRNETATTGNSRSKTTSETATGSRTFGNSQSKGGSFGVGIGGSQQPTNPVGMMTNFSPLGLFQAMAPSVSFSRYGSQTTSESNTCGSSKTRSQTHGFSQSFAKGWGREYINAHAQAAENQLQQVISRYERAQALQCWNVGAYFLAEDSNTALQGGAQLAALLSGGNSSLEPLRVHDLGSVWSSGAQIALSELAQLRTELIHPQTQELLEHPLGSAFNGLTTPLNTEELSLFINLPQREVAGVRVMPTADFSLNPPPVKENGIHLGNLLEGGRPTPLTYSLSPNDLAKHALVTGITGSGKSTTCRRLLEKMHQKGIPFLVVEPAKQEYVEWAMEFNRSLNKDEADKRIAVFMPGKSGERWRGQPLLRLTLNPFQIINPDQLLPHIDRTKSIFNATFPMQEILPVLLEEVLFQIYKSNRWFEEGSLNTSAEKPTTPTLEQTLKFSKMVVGSYRYSQEITDNLTACLTARFQGLLRGWKSDLFNRSESTAWIDMFDRPAVINLSYLGDDADKAFAMSVLLNFLYEYRQGQHETESSEPGYLSDKRSLRHLTVIEEAHRILLNTSMSSLDQMNPQGKVAEMFSNILSEIRAYREGLLIVDQVPARLIPDAVKNTNLKIVHRLVAADDREAMSAAMALTKDQSNIIPRLRPGQAIIHGEQDDMAAWIQVPHQSPF